MSSLQLPAVTVMGVAVSKEVPSCHQNDEPELLS